MNETTLYNQLKEAYTDANLNYITSNLIELHKSKQYDKIREISNKLSSYVLIDEEKASKCFSRLVMLYHPDKGEFYRKTIEHLQNSRKFDELREYSHILLMLKIDFNAIQREIDEDIDYSPEYRWDDCSGYDYYGETGDEAADIDYFFLDEENGCSFYNAVKIRMYGNTRIEFPSYYLEDFDDIEMAESNIESLDGIEYCKHVISLDLSGNSISDLSGLWELSRMEELYLSDNQIGFIDALSNLLNLRIVDLSGNEIDDISQLFNLEKLEYVNVWGNKVPKEQINKLKKKGVIVIS